MNNALIGECGKCEVLIMTNDDWHYEGDELWCDPCAEKAFDDWEENKIAW
jgi:formylmethanofuran dehydrogenase subunit E